MLGSAGSNRIRSALLQTIIGVVDRHLGADERRSRRRACTSKDGIVFAEPGIDLSPFAAELRTVSFSALNLFFGGVQAALRRDGALSGAGDPRRGGGAVLRVSRGEVGARRTRPAGGRPRRDRLRRDQVARPVHRHAQRRGPARAPDAARQRRRRRALQRHDHGQARATRRSSRHGRSPKNSKSPRENT